MKRFNSVRPCTNPYHGSRSLSAQLGYTVNWRKTVVPDRKCITYGRTWPSEDNDCPNHIQVPWGSTSIQAKPGFPCTIVQLPRSPQISSPPIHIQWSWDTSLAPELCSFTMTRPGDKSGVPILHAVVSGKQAGLKSCTGVSPAHVLFVWKPGRVRDCFLPWHYSH